MEKPYWGDAMSGFSYGTDTTHPDQQHHMDFLAKIPQSTSLLIELDLRGIDPPRFVPLSENLPATLQPQKPDTAQIFLCASSADAKAIFQHRGTESTAEYIERIATSKTRGSYEELLMPYDPRCLFDWLAIQPGQVCKISLPEYIAIPSEPRAYQLFVRSEIHMTRGSENEYTAVWFDFRDVYNVEGELAVIDPSPPNPTLPDIPASTWQRQFAHRFQNSRSKIRRHTTDFPSFLLLDLLETDIMAFQESIHIDQRMGPISTNGPNVLGNLGDRLYAFELLQSSIRKAESIHRFVTYMSSSQALDLVATESRSSYTKSLHRLEIGSSFAISELRRQDELADKRLDFLNRFAQERQARSLSAITYCAAFFLPLSLAATFLSMQSRAQDLHLIVYDFCGMTTVFFTVAVLIYLVSRLCSGVKTVRLTRHFTRNDVHESLVTSPLKIRYFVGFAWVLMVGSFLVGMLHNLRLGLIMLATPLAVPVLALPCIIVSFLVAGAFKEFRRIRIARAQGNSKDDMEARRE